MYLLCTPGSSAITCLSRLSATGSKRTEERWQSLTCDDGEGNGMGGWRYRKCVVFLEQLGVHMVFQWYRGGREIFMAWIKTNLELLVYMDANDLHFKFYHIEA